MAATMTKRTVAQNRKAALRHQDYLWDGLMEAKRDVTDALRHGTTDEWQAANEREQLWSDRYNAATLLLTSGMHDAALRA